jgi:AraC-like DNA-binding protein
MQISTPFVFDNIDELNAFPHGWDVQFRSPGRGEKRFTMEQAGTHDLVVNCAGMSGASIQRGSTPVGMRTFAIVLHSEGGLFWRGMPVDQGSLMIFGEDRELDCTSATSCRICTLSISEQLIKSYLQACDTPLTSLPAEARAGTIDKQAMDQLHRSIRIYSEFMGRYGADDRRFTEQRDLLQENLQCVVMTKLHTAAADDCRIPTARGYRVVRLALDYIHHHLCMPIRVSAVCHDIGVGERTLELAFRKHLNRTPRQVISHLRLAAVRRRLLLSSPDQSRVGEIAGQWGYWHMGQFARDYTRAFGERPLETLRRCE